MLIYNISSYGSISPTLCANYNQKMIICTMPRFIHVTIFGLVKNGENLSGKSYAIHATSDTRKDCTRSSRCQGHFQIWSLNFTSFSASHFKRCRKNSTNFDGCIKDALNDVRVFFKTGEEFFSIRTIRTDAVILLLYNL